MISDSAGRNLVAGQRRRIRVALAVVLLAVVALFGAELWLLTARNTDLPTAGPAPTGAVSGELPVGTAADTVEIWFDPACIHCSELDHQLTPMLRDGVAKGRLRVVYHPVALLDSNSPDHYSLRAVNVLAAVFEACPAAFDAVRLDLLANRPGPRRQIGDQELVQRVEAAGCQSAVIGPAIRERRFVAWARQATDAAERGGVVTVPTLRVNGREVPYTGPEETEAAVRSELGW